MAYHPFRHLGLKFVSIGLAVLLWLTVAREPIVERSLRVPLQFQNVPQALEIAGDPPAAVDVRVRGSSDIVSRLEVGEVAAVLDLGSARPGLRLFHLMPADVRAPYGVEVEQVLPSTVALEFERSGSRVVPVVPDVEGEPAPGFAVGEIISDPATVEVVGPESRLKQLTEATTEPVSVAGARADVRDVVTVGLTDSALRLKEVSNANVVVAVKPVPVERSIAGVRIEARNLQRRLQAELTPGVVVVQARGRREALNRIRERDLVAFVDLAGLGPGRYNLPVRIDPVQDVGLGDVEPPTIQVRIR